jgi:enoyl-CoA hydratase
MSAVLLEERTGGIVTLTLNRPEKLNALNLELMTALSVSFEKLGADKSVQVAILTGAGEKAFVAGADIEAMSGMTVAQAKAFSDLGLRVGGQMESAHFPILGAINGFALGGGCELALACDFLYASEKAKFGQPEVNLGVIPGFGGSQRLPRRIGASAARELCFTGDIIGAEEALRLGLVNKIFPAAELRAKAMETATKIAAKGPLAIAACKRVMVRGEDVSLPVACELEAQAFAGLFGSHDQKEGMKAFVEKRAAKFTGA